MKVLKALFIVAVAIVATFALIGVFLPKVATVERSTTIAAAPATVFALVDGFTRFNEWSPWASLDPATKYAYSGPERGVGARMEWSSDNPDVGNGSQEIIAIEPGRSVTSALDLGMDTPTTTTMVLTPEGTGTLVTWTLTTDFSSSLVGRYFGLALDGMVGPDYDKGLAQLKELAESSQTSRPSGQVTPVPPRPQ
jgi:uncharacterized protein YndB with AHSA1/START domain